MPKTLKSSMLRHAAHMANDLYWFILPLVLPQLLETYDLSYGQGGGILTVYLAVSAVGAYLMGRISDRLPRRLLMGIGFFVSAAGLVSAGFAPTYPIFMGFVLVTALGMSTFHPAMYAHIDETFGEGRGKVLARWEASGTLAILIMFLVNGALIERIGVRGVLVITSVPAVLVGIMMVGARPMDRVPASGPSSSPAGRSGASLGLFILFLISVVLRVASVASVLNFLTTIFTSHFRLPADRAVWSSGLYFAGSIVGALAAIRFAKPKLAYMVLILGAAVLAPLILLMGLSRDAVFPVVLTLLLGVAGSGTFVGQNLILGSLSADFGKGEAFGIMMAVMTLSASVSPAFFGMLVDARGFETALMIFAIPVLLSSLMLLLLRKRIVPILK